MKKSNCGATPSLTSDEIHIALKSVERNARQLLSDAELLFDHGRYGRAAALGVLAVEEVGKFYLLKWNRTKLEKATRQHGSKQRTVATVSLSIAASARAIAVLQHREKKWIDAHGGIDKLFVYEVPEQGLLREAFNGTLSKLKELGFYVDLSEAHEILTDPYDVRKEQAADSISFAKTVIARIIGS